MNQISIFDMFKISVGPSSSHTMGPWKAALLFGSQLLKKNLIKEVQRVEVHLFGSLALTGKGHGTDKAIIMGLQAYLVEEARADVLNEIVDQVSRNHVLNLSGSKNIAFNPANDIIFHFDRFLDFHSNALQFIAFDRNDFIVRDKYYYSVGGGFIIEENEETLNEEASASFPYPINEPIELLNYCKAMNVSISTIVMENEKSINTEEYISNRIHEIWEVMTDCAWEGIRKDGILPGGLGVRRRSGKMNMRLLPDFSGTTKERWLNNIYGKEYNFNQTLDWISTIALAINEENASFGRVVTAPTNGAAGVIPAVLFYHLYLSDSEKKDGDIVNFLLVASEIGSLFKKGATISAAMGGCQAEIGVSSAMAAAALTEVRGGTVAQCLMAAEIAMEHHLGMTCDPVKGLVQVPCIERNSMGAIKAIGASNLALKSEPAEAMITLDDIIKTMWKTSQAMHSDYKETSRGGLASTVDIAEC